MALGPIVRGGRRSPSLADIFNVRALELEELSRRIRELSESLPSESRRSHSQSSSQSHASEHRVEQVTIQRTIEPVPFRSGHPPTIPEEPEFSCGSLERFLRS